MFWLNGTPQLLLNISVLLMCLRMIHSTVRTPLSLGCWISMALRSFRTTGRVNYISFNIYVIKVNNLFMLYIIFCYIHILFILYYYTYFVINLNKQYNSIYYCNIQWHIFYIIIKSNHFYCHITTAQVPWWVKFLRACSRQCKKKQKKITYGQYIFTDYTEDNVQNTHTYTQYTQCTIKTYLVILTPSMVYIVLTIKNIIYILVLYRIKNKSFCLQ